MEENSMCTSIVKLVAVVALLAGASTFGTVASAAPGVTTGGADVTSACAPGVLHLGSGLGGYYIQNYCQHEVQTPSGNANVSFHADLAAPSTAPDKAVTFTGFICFTSYGPTTDSKATVTPSGEVNGECHYHA